MSHRALPQAFCQHFCRAPVYRSRATPLAETLNRAAPEATPAFFLPAQMFPVALFRASLDSRKDLCGFLLTDEPQRYSLKESMLFVMSQPTANAVVALRHPLPGPLLPRGFVYISVLSPTS